MTLTDLIRECERVGADKHLGGYSSEFKKLLAIVKIQTEALRKCHEFFMDEYGCDDSMALTVLTASEKIASGNGIITPREEE